jgi:hypothetical protein
VLRPDGSNIGVPGDLIPAAREQGFPNEGTSLHEELAAEQGDILPEKPGFGAFHGTDLELNSPPPSRPREYHARANEMSQCLRPEH